MELCSQTTINELYQCLDLYPMTSRVEGGPQSLIECGLLNVPVISTPCGMSRIVLSNKAISEEFTADSLFWCSPTVPDVSNITLPDGFKHYRELMLSL